MLAGDSSFPSTGGLIFAALVELKGRDRLNRRPAADGLNGFSPRMVR